MFWSPYAVDTCDLANTYPTPNSEAPEIKRIFHLGTVEANYGCFFMIIGLARLHLQRTDWHACFVGKGPDLEAARLLVHELGLESFIDFPGYVDENKMISYLALSSLFLSHLNDTEQDWARCPSKLYYYMAQFKPIVTSFVGENRLALGDCGFYYRADSETDFARAVNEALNAGEDWKPSFTPDSLTWRRRTLDFLSELEYLTKA
jgi:glycosyltransferase involved in cell wall biosynthesis